jgi:endonuclease/exonuclease/phosphatase family metal-dependent hydrolase
MLFVSYNIQYGTGKDGKIDLARIADSVRGADVVALQEVDRHWPRTGDVDQPGALGALLPDYYWVYGPGYDMHADDAPPGNRRRQFGNMVMSRTPIVSSRTHLLPKYGAAKLHSIQRSAVEAVIDTPKAGPMRVYSTHLSHLSDGDRGPQIDRLLEIYRNAPSEGGAWCGGHKNPEWTQGRAAPPMPAQAVFMGDFNMTADSPLYERLVGPMAREYGRMTALDGLVDAYVAAGHAEDSGNTCDSTANRKLFRIDYCFASSSFADRIKRAWIDDKAQGSDHQPIWTEIDL